MDNGEVFEKDEWLYMKVVEMTTEDEDYINAIELFCGELTHFHRYDQVLPHPTARLFIGD